MKKLLTILFICLAFTTSAQTVSITSSASGSICAGTSVTFTATPSGYTTPSYQWYKNEIAISGETGATYTTTSLTNNDLIYVTVKDLNPPSGGSITTNGLIVQLDASDPTSYTSGTTWTDKKGNANGAINGAVSYESNGSASYFSFPGANNDYIKSSLNQAIKDFTIVFQPDFSSFNYSGGHTLFSKGPGVDYSMRFWSYNFSGLSNPNASAWGAPNLSTNTNDWLGTNSLFLNGVNNQTGFAPLVYGWNVLGGAGGTNGSGFGNFPYCLGAGAAGRSFQGKIAVVLFYDRTLTSAEQQQNFDALKSRFAFASNAIITNVNASPSIPTITVTGDTCVNKTILNTTSGLSSYSWTKNNLAIPGATTTTYSPTASGDYKVAVSNGTCSTASAATTIYTCGATSDGKMVSVANSGSLLSSEGGANFGTTMDEVGKILNTTGLTTTTATIAATTAVLGGVISATNAVTSSIGVMYSTDPNFNTSSSSTIQSNVVAGAYTTNITGLTAVTNYYAKSFITNKAGTSYGPVVSFVTSSPPVSVGDVYQGGIVFYVLQPGDNGYDANVQHGLIAPFSSISRQSPNPLPPIVESQIGLNAATIAGAQFDGILKGKTNTDAIILNQGSTGTYAALYCRNYTNPTSKTFNSVTYIFPVYTDWYMPSIVEINKFRAYLWNVHPSRGTYYNYGNNLIYYRGISGNGNDYAWGKMLSSTMTGNRYKLYYLESGNEDGSTAYNGWTENDRLVVMPIRSF